MKNNTFLQKAVDIGILCTIIFFPVTINISLKLHEDPVHPLFSLNFSLADLIIGILLSLWILKLVIYNEWKSIKWPPLPVFILAVVWTVTFVNASSKTEWLKEILKVTEYFILFFALLINNIKTIKISVYKNTLLIISGIFVLLAFFQHSILGAEPYFVKGLFENRVVLGSFLCLVVPIAYIEMISSNNITKKGILILFLILTIWVSTSGSALLSILISIILISWVYNKKTLLRLVYTICIITILYPFVMPEKNKKEIINFISVFEQGDINENYYRRLNIIDEIDKAILYKKDFGFDYLQITLDKINNVSVPYIRKGERYKEVAGKDNIKNLYIEMQAALNMAADNFLLGVGAGNYQNHIGSYFKDLPKINTTEPNQNNTYLLIASTTGILGLSAFLWLLFSFLRLQYMNYKTYNKLIYLGLFGSFIAVSVEGVFSFLLNSSLMVPMVFLFYFSQIKGDINKINE